MDSLPSGTISQEVLLTLVIFCDEHLHVEFPARKMRGWPAGGGDAMTIADVERALVYLDRLGLITRVAPDIYQINAPDSVWPKPKSIEEEIWGDAPWWSISTSTDRVQQ